MPAIVTNAQKFILTSDYPPEKVVHRKNGTEAINVHPTHSDAQLFTYPHGLGFVPLCRGSYRFQGSTSADWLAFDTSPPILSNVVGTTVIWADGVTCVVYSDATNVYLYVWNNLGVTISLDYRIVGFADAIADVEVAATNSITTTGLTFDSDNNYLKIINSGSGDVPVPAGTYTVPIPHNLGYKPTSFVWTLNPDNGFWGYLGTENYIGVTSYESSMVITDSSLILTLISYGVVGTARYAYRVFADA
jgi:hypothetical protein